MSQLDSLEVSGYNGMRVLTVLRSRFSCVPFSQVRKREGRTISLVLFATESGFSFTLSPSLQVISIELSPPIFLFFLIRSMTHSIPLLFGKKKKLDSSPGKLDFKRIKFAAVNYSFALFCSVSHHSLSF